MPLQIIHPVVDDHGSNGAWEGEERYNRKHGEPVAHGAKVQVWRRSGEVQWWSVVSPDSTSFSQQNEERISQFLEVDQ